MATETISKVRNSSVGYLNQMKEQLWLREHGREFIGQWVVLDGDRLVGHGPDPQPIVAQARAEGVAAPFVELISEEKGPFMGGWLWAVGNSLFPKQHFYGTDAGIIVPIVLHTSPATRVQLRAKLDTGSDLCIFQPLYARFLGLELTSGIRQVIGTSTGAFVAYGHEVAVTVLNLEWQATVYFAEPDNFPVNVVGQSGFLNHIRLGLVEHDQFLYLADYNS